MSDDDCTCPRCGEQSDAPGALCLACFDDDQEDDPISGDNDHGSSL